MNVTIAEAMKLLKANRGRLTRQQIKTFKGQVLAGDPAAAIKGLNKLLAKNKAKQNETEEKTS